MIPRCFPTTVDTVTAGIPPEMNVYFLSSVSGLTAWVDYIPVKAATSSFTPQGTTNTGGYQAVNIFTSTTGKIAWVDYIPVYEIAGTNPWVDHIPVALGVNSAGQGASDPNFANVTLLMHMDDTGLTDVKGNTVTITGNAARSATQSKFGGYSSVYDGAGDRLSIPINSNTQFGSGNFTVEAWVYPVSLSGTVVVVTGQGDLATVAGSGWGMNITSAAGTCDVATGSTFYSIQAPNPTVGEWSHIAFVREGGVLSSYKNGSRVATRSDLGTSSINNGAVTYPPVIGGNGLGTSVLNGYIDEVRITKGIARYSGATYTVPTAAFPNS